MCVNFIAYMTYDFVGYYKDILFLKNKTCKIQNGIEKCILLPILVYVMVVF